jgi:hypothetical protein
MRTLFPLLTLLAACKVEYDLADVRRELDVWVAANAGAPQELAQWSDEVYVAFSAPDDGCVFLDSSARVLVDSVRAAATVREGINHSGCDGMAFELQGLPAPRETSMIELVDDSARVTITVPQLLVNATFSVTGPLQRGGTATLRVEPTRPIESAAVRWVPSNASAADWSIYNRQVTAPGEIPFEVPANAPLGPGTLQVDILTMRDSLADSSLCPDLGHCSIFGHGGGVVELVIE